MITLTEEAAQKIETQIAKRGRGQGIKIGVRTTGCSGLAYTLEFVDVEPSTQEAALYESHGIKVWVEGKAAPYLAGTTMSWERKGLNEGFEFLNPNEAGRCGCGESFNV